MSLRNYRVFFRSCLMASMRVRSNDDSRRDAGRLLIIGVNGAGCYCTEPPNRWH